MNQFIQQFQRHTLLRAIVYLALGIFALTSPHFFTKIIIYILAGYFAFLGILNLINASQNRKYENTDGQRFFAIFQLIFAAAILVLAKPLLTMITFVVGVFVLVNGLIRLNQTIQLKRTQQFFLPWLVYAILMILAGFMLMFRSVSSIMWLIGTVFLFMGISEFINFYQLKRTRY